MHASDDVTLREESPSAEELVSIRAAMGWGVSSMEAAEASVKNCPFSVCLRVDGNLVGLGRIVGDGGLYYYIQDVIVLLEYQGRGYGTLIMQRIMSYLDEHALHGATIGLLAATGKEAFYAKFGFIERPNERMGSGMCQYVRKQSDP